MGHEHFWQPESTGSKQAYCKSVSRWLLPALHSDTCSPPNCSGARQSPHCSAPPLVAMSPCFSTWAPAHPLKSHTVALNGMLRTATHVALPGRRLSGKRDPALCQADLAALLRGPARAAALQWLHLTVRVQRQSRRRRSHHHISSARQAQPSSHLLEKTAGKVPKQV